MGKSEGKSPTRGERTPFAIVNTRFLRALSGSDLTPTELSLLMYLLSRMTLGTSEVRGFVGITAAEEIGAHHTTVSTALGRLESRKIVRRRKRTGGVDVVVNANLASRADRAGRARLRKEQGMPKIAITRTSTTGR